MQNAQVHIHQAPAAEADLDVEYIASLLYATPSSNPGSRVTQRKRQRSRQSKPHRPAVLPEQRVPHALVSRYNRPVSQPGLKNVRCEACSCSVGAGEQAWRIHTAGEKHQRQIVSLQHTGQLGNTLLSVFEPVPDTRQVDNSSTALNESAKRFRCQFPQRLAKLRTNAMKNILNLSGSYTQRTADQYSQQELSFAFAVVTQKHAEALASCDKVLSILCSTPNQIVCLADVLTEQHQIKQLRLTGQHSTDRKQHPEEVMAVQMLLQALQSQPQLEYAHIHMEEDVQIAQPSWLDLCEPSCNHSYESFTGSVTGILLHGWWLRYLEIQLPAKMSDMALLTARCTWAARQAHQRRREQLTTALLMGTHVRLGASSWLRQLPVHILQDIMRLAMPAEPCEVAFASTGRCIP